MNTSLSRSITVPYGSAEMFDLVDAVELYPEFLPWCAGSSVERDGEVVRASVDVQFGPFRKTFSTLNRHVRPERIDVKLEKGPLDDLEGVWRFSDSDDGKCTVSMEIEFRFSGSLHQRVANTVLMAIYGRMLNAFHQRARKVYGKRTAKGDGCIR